MWGWIAGLGVFFILLLLALFILPFVFWILKIVRLSKNEDKTGMWVVLVCGIFLSPLIGLLIGLAFKEDDKNIEKEKNFHCGICYLKYKSEYLGGEFGREGKICRFCLEKRQRGESAPTPNYSSETYPQPRPNTPDYYSHFQSQINHSTKESNEKKILLRQLNRVQSKKNSFLTQFIINLAVLQWLLPLLAVTIFWMDLKSQMKSQLLANNLSSSTSETPFKSVIKDVFNFKIFTADPYTYSNFRLTIATSYKIGIILAFLLPLGLWIYNLIRFLGVNGEFNQLQGELKELD